MSKPTPMSSRLVDLILPVPLPGAFTYRWVAPAVEVSTGTTPDASVDARVPAVGDLAVVPFGRRQEVIGLVVAVEPDTPEQAEVAGRRLRRVKRLLPPEYSLDDGRRELAGWLADYYAVSPGEVVPLFHPPAPGTKARRSRPGSASPDYPDVDARDIVLTAAQEDAIGRARALLDARQYGVVLVHGVTGSGKTEVFLRAIEACLDAGHGAIYLLPEIALTPQTLARITARFGERAAALHSRLSAGERSRVHEAAARGEVSVVVGPRSALFAPVRDLGLIVVDEEHETSFKQEEKPRYHARHAALVRARGARAAVLLGSATPDLESFHNARSGLYELVSLRERMGADLPAVELVDMRGSPAVEGFSTALSEAIDGVLAAERQVLLYYNRRGFARALQCGDCGEAVTCPRCDIALTYHLRPRRLLCHYCGHARRVPHACPDCRSEGFLASGGGTEKVELALQALFPGTEILRLDQDTTRRRGSHARILAAFAAGEAPILVGTQMVAKGHHFPGLDLVGVLAADDGLTLPDYRAGERAFQLLTQVAGRAGRTQPGRVLFQTYRPEDPIILAAAAHDYETFVMTEMAARRELDYPPFVRLVRLAVSGRKLGAVEEAAGQLAAAVRDQLEAWGATILGPAPAVFARLQDRYRFQILVKGKLGVRQKAWLTACVRSLEEARRGITAFVDVDPLTIY